MSQLEKVVITLDEMEAIRLADLESLYHQDAALQMEVSRQTFDRIVGKGRSKIAKALIEGKALLIQGENK